jgi:hypothetical protein
MIIFLEKNVLKKELANRDAEFITIGANQNEDFMRGVFSINLLLSQKNLTLPGL